MLFMVPAADGTIIDLQQLWLEILAAGEDGDLARSPSFAAGLMTGVRFHMMEPGLGEALVALFEREAGPSQNLTPEQIEVQIRALVAELIGNARLERSA